jgi:hypothetical protein
MVRHVMVMGLVVAVVGAGALSARAQDVAATQASTQPATLEERMQGWWADLEKGEPEASRAVLKFSETPAETTAFFADRLQPLTISMERLGDLLVQLGSDNDAVWKGAFEQLQYFDPRLTVDLEPLMDNATDDVMRARLVEVLTGMSPGTFKGKSVTLKHQNGDNYYFVCDNSWYLAEMHVERLSVASKPAWLRAVRAMTVLEHIGGTAAFAILQDMATGNADAQPTKVAKEMVEEMLKAQNAKLSTQIGG